MSPLVVNGLPIQNVNFHGEFWRVTGLCAGASSILATPPD
jgi:hypothetical protein